MDSPHGKQGGLTQNRLVECVHYEFLKIGQVDTRGPKTYTDNNSK